MRRAWGTKANSDFEWRLKDGTTNIVSVGPFVESSNIERLVSVFAFYLSLGEEARLVLVGTVSREMQLIDRFYALVAKSGLAGRIVLVENPPPAYTAAAYAAAKLYVSLSNQETPAEPLLDAMSYDVPILAIAEPRSRETLGSGGILVEDAAGDLEIATIASYLVRDPDLRRTVLAEQRKRLRAIGSRSA